MLTVTWSCSECCVPSGLNFEASSASIAHYCSIIFFEVHQVTVNLTWALFIDKCKHQNQVLPVWQTHSQCHWLTSLVSMFNVASHITLSHMTCKLTWSQPCSLMSHISWLARQATVSLMLGIHILPCSLGTRLAFRQILIRAVLLGLHLGLNSLFSDSCPKFVFIQNGSRIQRLRKLQLRGHYYCEQLRHCENDE